MDRERCCSDLLSACEKGKDALAELAVGLGFAEPEKSATNLQLLQEEFDDCGLLADVASAALAAADPDLALNSLERLTGCAGKVGLLAVLAEETARARLLTVLGASPFLTGILCRRKHYFHDLFTGEIDRRKSEEEMLQELRERTSDTADFADLQKELRFFKAREILRIGSRDLCGLADLVEVTAELSSLAAAALQRSYEICDALLRAEHGAPLVDEPEEGCSAEPEFTVFGMGKFGGRELNFSSDIDLIYFYSTEKGRTAGIPDVLGKPKNSLSLHQYFCKLSELITRALGQATENGFVFRVDLGLRPEGVGGEMANSLRSAEVYYESWGQSWERSAMIKARPVAGSIALGERLLKSLDPFIYRKHLDYGMIEDIKLMKQKIDRSLTKEREGELNLKLGRGGIREIEFFIQALQLIYAGKNPALREKNSLKSLSLLAEHSLIKEEEARTLAEAYTFLRDTEHRIQVVQERQTHHLPSRPEEMKALGRRCSFEDAESFEEALDGHRQGVSAIYRDLFFTGEEEIRDEVRPEVRFLFDPAADPDLVKDLLEEKGFKNVEGAYDSLLLLRDGQPNARLTERARRHLERIAPLFMQEVLDSPEPDMALGNLERFLAVKRARGTFYALLAENLGIIKLLTSLFGTSQFLSRIFIQHPESLDALVSSSHSVAFKEREEMEEDLAEMLRRAEDYEEKLDVLRRFRNEEFLRVALNDLQGITRQGAGTTQLSYLADVCLSAAVDIARKELLPRFGLPYCDDCDREAPFAIVGMGKHGGMELNYHSDLDIIFVYEGKGKTRPAEGTDPNRFRAQSNQEYFSRLAQRIISVLTLKTREGDVYEIDTRLRPSGNQGPLVTSLSAFEAYHESSAQLWERQALTKARVLCDQGDFAAKVEKVIENFAYERPLAPGLREEIYRLRNRMEVEIAKENADHFNIKTGRGGMVDVEFIVQYLQLLHGREKPSLRCNNTLGTLDALSAEKILTEEETETLSAGYRFLRRLENKLRLVHDQSMNEISGEKKALVKLARRLGYPDRPVRPDVAFLQEYKEATEKIRAIFDRLLGAEATEEA